MFVFVQNKKGEPLMPTKRCGKVKWLLRRKQARVVCAEPFTIRLLYDTTEYLQELYVGIDVGTKHIGISISTEKEEVLSATAEQRTDIKELLEERRGLRSRRRSDSRPRKQKDKRGKWNAGAEEKCFGPSALNKINAHIRIVKFLSKLLPLEWKVKSCTLEIGKFDTALMKDPSLSGTDYQNGVCKDYENKKAFVRHRDGYECQHCHGKTGDVRLDVHHIIWKSKGGPDDVDNLITLCHTCHEDLHKNRFQLEVSEDLKKKSALYLSDAAMMNTIRFEVFKRFKEAFPTWNIYKTTGLFTSQNRNAYGIEKSHSDDAYVIAGNFNVKRSDVTYTGYFFRSHNRKLHKSNNIKNKKKTGVHIRKKNQGKHMIKGFIKYDRVIYKGKRGVITSTMSSGYAIVTSLVTKKKIHEQKVVPMKDLVFIEHGHTIMFEQNRK